MQKSTRPVDDIGLVEPKTKHFSETLALASGSELHGFDIVYETYGKLNKECSNAILICHALSGDHHVAGYHTPQDKKPGWWNNIIGPNKTIDTNRFFVVSPNNIGGCSGSSGPLTINPVTDSSYGPNFPLVTVKDWVKTQAMLADKLGIDVWTVIIGGSLGGMQCLEWSISYPSRVKNTFIIAAAPKLSTQNIAFNEVSRQAIRSDQNFNEGNYYESDNKPELGLMLARMLGHITYLSDDALDEKFGRELRGGEIKFGYEAEFQIESYLRYQGRAFVDRFDANSYLLLTKVLDYFDPAGDTEGSLSKAMAPATAKFLIISFSSDWRFSPERSQEIVSALLEANKCVSYIEIQSTQGHDSFLMPIPRYHQVLKTALDRIAKGLDL
jgi:homoserine O-acetyltransferase/O-succinyltransferase